MFNYSEANLENLNNDLDSTLEECKKLVENIKSSTNVNLNDFNELERTVYDVSGRIAFLGDVHPEEKIRDFGNEAEDVIPLGRHTCPINICIVCWDVLSCCRHHA